MVAFVDRRRLEQALANLVENALRHGSGAVRLEVVELPEAIVLHVTDEGPGFPPQFLERAFERFSHADGSHAGAGLGPGMVAAIAHAHTAAPAQHRTRPPEAPMSSWSYHSTDHEPA